MYVYMALYIMYDIDLVQKSLPDHIDSCMSSHLLLSLDCMRSQQQTIIDLTARLKSLEEEHNKHTASLSVVASGLAAANQAIDHSHAKHTKTLTEQISKLDKTHTKRLHDTNASIQSDLTRLNQAMYDVCKQIKEIKTMQQQAQQAKGK